jgi:hypothetical protein
VGHRYWRIYITESRSTGTYFAQIAEIQFRATNGGADQTGSGTAYASSSYVGFPASNAFDDVGTTSWLSDNAAALPQWIAYDFGSDVDVAEILIKAADNSTRATRAPKKFYVEYSDDNSTWTTVYISDEQAAWSISQERVYDLEIKAYLLGRNILHNSFSAIAALDVLVNSATGTMLGAFQAQAESDPSITGSVGSVLGIPYGVAYHDFTGLIEDSVDLYVMDLITPSGVIRAPISSWQATLQTGASNYVQCVVPAVFSFVDAINAATEFVIYRTAIVPGAEEIEYEMARAPLQNAQFNRGPFRYTCTLSGYSPAFANDEPASSATDRQLEKIRSVSGSTGGLRIRCAVDWLLRPNQKAIVDGTPITAAYINYYVGRGDAYMDVGERV